MRIRIATVAALLLTAAALAAALVFGGKGDAKAEAASEAIPGTPSVEIISPRNGARQTSHAVVVKVDVENFQLAPLQFERPPLLGEGHIRFSLNRVPDCVDPKKLQDAINSPVGNGRLIGRSFDYPETAGPNGVLAERIGSAGSYSPATKPEIYYRALPPGFYRLTVTLAQNNGATTPFHAVTNFQIVEETKRALPSCEKGKVPAAAAAKSLR